MIKSYFTVAFRNILRHKLYAFINIAGLAVGLACCILVVLFIQRELAFNQFHEKKDRLYRVLRESKKETLEVRPGISGAWADVVEETFPGVESTLKKWSARTWTLANDKVFERWVCVTDPHYFEVMDFELVAGDPSTVLREPNGIVLSESTARLYFGDEDPIGQTVTLEDLHFDAVLTVTGIMRDPRPDTSWHFWFDAVTSTRGTELAQRMWTRWDPHTTWRPIDTYVLMKPDADVNELRRQMPDLLRRHLGDEVAKTDAYRLQAFDRMYVYVESDTADSWAMQRITSYATIAVAILLIACINFMNLATARSMLRSQEVGLRKTVGASRGQLMVQFLAESLLLSLLAFVIALGLARLLLPTFELFIDQTMEIGMSMVGESIPILLAITVITGLVAGSYPALFLSRMRPLHTLRGDASAGRSGLLRKALVVTQFAVAVCLLIGTLTVNDQIEYITNRPLGFDKENVVILPIYQLDRQSEPETARRIAFQNEAVKEAFLAHPDVVKVSAGRATPGTWPGMRRKWKPEDRPEAAFDVYVKEGDKDFVDFFGLNLRAGRTFDGSDRDTASVILNQSAVRLLGWDDPIGRQVTWIATGKLLTIIGVIDDYQNRSLRETVAPGAVIQFPALYYALYLKINPGTLQELLPFLAETWKTFLPNRPFRFTTIEEELGWHYWNDNQFRKSIRVFCGLAMLLGCLGLYGLAAFSAERRTKEIGVRKVLGASPSGLLGLMGKEFAVLVGIANLIAWPAAYFYLDDWLNGFVQRIDLSVVPFVLGGSAVLIVAFVTVSFRTYAAATSNPVEAIRIE